MKARALGEKDRLLWLLTPDLGALRAVARGAQTGRSEASLYDPPTELEVRLKESSGLSAASQAVLNRPYSGIKGSLPHLAAAGFFARLTLATLEPGQGDSGLYRVLLELLEALELRLEPRPLGLWGQRAYLERLGAHPELSRCLGCGALVAESPGAMRFQPASGGVYCSDCPAGEGWLPFSEETRELIEALEVPLLELSFDRSWSECASREAGLLFREQFRWQLGVSGELFRPLFGRSNR